MQRSEDVECMAHGEDARAEHEPSLRPTTQAGSKCHMDGLPEIVRKSTLNTALALHGVQVSNSARR